MALLDELSALLNKNSAENESDTPDYLLAEFLFGCLKIWNSSIQQREVWHGRKRPDATSTPAPEIEQR